jgi:hypothetical protein
MDQILKTIVASYGIAAIVCFVSMYIFRFVHAALDKLPLESADSKAEFVGAIFISLIPILNMIVAWRTIATTYRSLVNHEE